MAANDLTAARLRELFSYDPETGVFTRLRLTSARSRIGEVAGGRSTDGYVHIRIDGRLFMAHRLAYLYLNGEWPSNLLDHRNGIKSDNRIANLRDADKILNGQNRRGPQVGSASGLLGVAPRHKRWYATIMVNKKRVWLGTFDTAELAHACYLNAKRRLHAGNTL